MRTLLVLLALAAPLGAAEKLDAKAVDALLDKALADFGAPGVACVVVRDDKVIHLAARGLRDREGKKPVTADTLLGIASCSKAFTAASVACLVADGKMRWDDPVRRHLPNFRMRDELADRDVTIRDLLCHRTGVIRHDILWLVHTDWTRDEMIRRSSQLRQDKPFRSVYGYNNFQYLMAGEAAGKAADMPWEQLVQKRLFDPLGMKTASFSTSELVKADDWAKPHFLKAGGKLETREPFNIDNMAPAGSLNVSAREMALWLRFQLGEGTFEGKKILPASLIREMHAPQVVAPLDDSQKKAFEDVTTQSSYGLGWRVQDYRGKRMVYHGGSLLGYRSQTTLLPDQKAGIFVATNLADTSLPVAVTHALANLLLESPKKEWNSVFVAADKKRVADAKQKDDDRAAKRKKGTKPSLPLADYAGTFDEAAHGRIRIEMDKAALTLHWGKQALKLEHFHNETFSVVDVPDYLKSALGDRQLTFRLDATGAAESFSMLGTEFRRTRADRK